MLLQERPKKWQKDKDKKKKKKKNPTSFHADVGSNPLASFSGLRIWLCSMLWYRLQMWLGSGIAVAVT